MNARRLIPALPFLLFLLSPAAGDPNKIDVCSMVTKANIEQIMSMKFEDGEPDFTVLEGYQCEYDSAEDNANGDSMYITISVYDTDTVRQAEVEALNDCKEDCDQKKQAAASFTPAARYDRYKEAQKHQMKAVEGVGEDAFLGVGDVLYFKTKNHYGNVSILRGEESFPEESRKIAALVASKVD